MTQSVFMIHDFTHGSDLLLVKLLKKVRKHVFVHLRTLQVLLCLTESYVLLFFWRVYLEKRSQIPASVAVVRGWPNGNKNVIGKPELVSLVDQLVSSCNHLKVVHMQKLLSHLWPEEPARSSSGLHPGLNVLWIRPHQIAEGSLNRNFLVSLNGSDLLHCSDFWGKPSVNTQDLVVHNCSKRKIVEKVHEEIPGIWVSVLLANLI